MTKNKLEKFAFLFVLISAGCARESVQNFSLQHSKFSQAPAVEPLQSGIYLPQAEAIELRATGMLDTLCAQIVQKNDFLINAVRIEGEKSFNYDPYINSEFQNQITVDLHNYLNSSKEEVERDFAAQENCFHKSTSRDEVGSGKLDDSFPTVEEAQNARHTLAVVFVQLDPDNMHTLIQDSDQIQRLGLSGAAAIVGLGGFVFSHRYARSIISSLENYDAMSNSIVGLVDTIVDSKVAGHKLLRDLLKGSANFNRSEELKGKILPFRGVNKSHKVFEVPAEVIKMPQSEKVAGTMFEQELETLIQQNQSLRGKVSEVIKESFDVIRKGYLKPSLTRARFGIWAGAAVAVTAVVATGYYSYSIFKQNKFSQKNLLEYFVHSREGLIEFLSLSDSEAEKAMTAHPELAKFIVDLQKQFSFPSEVKP